MPTVDTAFAQPAPPVSVSSPDGLLSATVDAANGGVLLFADFEGTALQAAGGADRVRFYRGDGTLVRSGDPAWAPGGTAVAYDHEAPVGGSVAYYAVPETLSGAQGAATATLAVSVPEPTDVRSLWLKSPLQPALSALVWVEDPPQIASAARTSVTPISGAPLGVTSWDVRTGMTTSMVIVTETAAEAATVEALLDAGPLLIQTKVAYDFPDAYWLPGDWSRDRVARMDNPMSRWTVPFVQCRRPATLDAPLMIPGNSYDTPPYVSYDAATATGLSYNALLGVTTAAPAGAGYGSGPYGTTPYGG